MDPQAMPTFAPTAPPLSAQKPTMAAMPSSPASFAAPWAATREKLQSTNPGMDCRSCSRSGGISDASTLPMHPPSGMGFAHHLLLLLTTLVQPRERRALQQGRMATDEVRKDRAPLPKLVIKGSDTTTLTRTINEWIQKTTISLNTRSQSAATFWAQVVGMARQRHNWWLSLSPDQRAMHIGLPATGQTIPLQLPILEATTRAELLSNVLQERVGNTSMQKGATTVLWPPLVSSDNAFATEDQSEVAQIFRTTQVKNNCTDETLLQTMGMLETNLLLGLRRMMRRGERKDRLITPRTQQRANLPRRGKQRRAKEQEKERMRHQETKNQFAQTT